MSASSPVYSTYEVEGPHTYTGEVLGIDGSDTANTAPRTHPRARLASQPRQSYVLPSAPVKPPDHQVAATVFDPQPPDTRPVHRPFGPR
jgi:hypothetical protein